MFDHYDAHGLPIACDAAEAQVRSLRVYVAEVIGERDQARAELAEARAALARAEQTAGEARQQAEGWRRLVSDLDRCPHGRHEGDTCAGWRGPGLWDGGCRDGISMGNPLHGGGATIGIDYSSTRLIVVPEDRADRVKPDAWYQPRGDDELWHFLPGYVGEEQAALGALAADVPAAATCKCPTGFCACDHDHDGRCAPEEEAPAAADEVTP